MSYTVAFIPALRGEHIQEASRLIKNVLPESIACNNWQSDYVPEVTFRMAHNGHDLFLHFRVRESYVKATIRKDNDTTCQDSCVELFLALDDTGYYNFEFNCIGKLLFAFQTSRQDAEKASPVILPSIRRFSTMGNTNFEEIQADTIWELTICIPATAFFRHRIENWSGKRARANLYKCGDKLSHPHYLSWQVVDTARPDFHVPRCFKDIYFQNI